MKNWQIKLGQGRANLGARCRALFLSGIVFAGLALSTNAMDKPVWNGGFQMGYTLGQNGYAWPNPIKDPLANNNRGGFYLSQARAKVTLPFDSTFKAVVIANVIFMDPQEIYLEKQFGDYTFTAGKFRGAGLKTGSGTDEFDRIPINTNRYSRLEDYYARTIGFRDFGMQVQKKSWGGDLQQKFFVHNANRKNIFNDESGGTLDVASQAGGVSYALDYKVSPYTTLGGHIGALVDHAWSEFVGSHDGWEAGYWFKTNPIVEGSFYHQMDFTKLHILNEALILSDRTRLSPIEGTATQLWGISSQLQLDHNSKWGSFYRYEFTDPSDGFYLNDNFQALTVGGIFHPDPVQYPGLKVTSEYVRTLEEGVRNTFHNDVFYTQLQMVF